MNNRAPVRWTRWRREPPTVPLDPRFRHPAEPLASMHQARGALAYRRSEHRERPQHPESPTTPLPRGLPGQRRAPASGAGCALASSIGSPGRTRSPSASDRREFSTSALGMLDRALCSLTAHVFRRLFGFCGTVGGFGCPATTVCHAQPQRTRRIGACHPRLSLASHQYRELRDRRLPTPEHRGLAVSNLLEHQHRMEVRRISRNRRENRRPVLWTA